MHIRLGDTGVSVVQLVILGVFGLLDDSHQLPINLLDLLHHTLKVIILYVQKRRHRYKLFHLSIIIPVIVKLI